MYSSCTSELHSETRIVTVAAFADEEFRENQQWVSLIESHISEVSKMYDSLFGIQFLISSLNEWESEDRIDDISDLLLALRAYSDPCITDIVIGFSLQSPTDFEKANKQELENGLSSQLGSELIVRFGRF